MRRAQRSEKILYPTYSVDVTEVHCTLLLIGTGLLLIYNDFTQIFFQKALKMA